ncbi:LytTR family DNA-binding domain-containing protein [Filimonas effusa]|uniref:LytTR family DNA-binding domain-containing protein n=1 Tax=Filimonas effusa TaxID=2508721 RepID=UPI0013E92C9F|nr:LytTR family DNA-binding domain-containing protein [Filimonas effusa]
MIRIPMKDIVLIKAAGPFTNIYTVNGEKYPTNLTLKEFEEILGDKEFCRVHRSSIIALPRIQSIEARVVDLGDRQVAVSRTYYPLLLSKIDKFFKVKTKKKKK